MARTPPCRADGHRGRARGTVTAATSQRGGFSDRLAARLRLADGRRAFAKAVDAGAARGVAERLTPAPRLNSGGVSPRLGGWARLADSPRSLAKPAVVAPDAARALDGHLALEARLPEAIAGETPAHGDLYPFNVLITDARVVVVDWPHAWTGPAYADLVMLLGSVALSGLDPEPYAARHPLLRGVDPEAVDVLISAQAGFLLAAACSMDSADADAGAGTGTGTGTGTDPRLEAMMTGLGRGALRWLSSRRG
ncbi:phosphotransferase [Streptomyces sp. NBC_01508]